MGEGNAVSRYQQQQPGTCQPMQTTLTEFMMPTKTTVNVLYKIPAHKNLVKKEGHTARSYITQLQDRGLIGMLEKAGPHEGQLSTHTLLGSTEHIELWHSRG